MSDTISLERKDQLDYRAAEIVAYVTDRMAREFSDVQVPALMKHLYHSNRYKQLTDYDTYLYTYTFDELYQLFLAELKEQCLL
jgi:hypothetical protein